MLLPLFRRLPWPLPALLAWMLAWAAFFAARAAALAPGAAFVLAAVLGALAALAADGLWRRALAAGGFPLSALALGALPGLPGWAWAVAALPLLLAYPLRAWRDAPFFPTPAAALNGIERVLALPDGGRGAPVLDAGCGLGHGLRALRRAWPHARFEGIEWSRPLAWWAARRCRFARIVRGDMWAASWAGYQLVYLFQRPESMARAWAKAEAELAPGAWLVSLEFEIPGVRPQGRLGDEGQRPVWIYRTGRAAAPLSPSTTTPRRR